MLTTTYRGITKAPAGGNGTSNKNHYPIPDLARSQVYQIGNAQCDTVVPSYDHFQVCSFTDTAPALATALFEAAGGCGDPTDDEFWDTAISTCSNLVAGNAAYSTIWMLTRANYGVYMSDTYPQGLRQNSRVIHVIDASLGSISNTNVLGGDLYGGSYKQSSSINPNYGLLVSRPGSSYAWLCLDASFLISQYFDKFLFPGPGTVVPTNAVIARLSTSGSIETLGLAGYNDETVMDAACVDPVTDELWVAMHDLDTTTGATSNIRLTRFTSALLQMNTYVQSDIITSLAFSNFGGVPIVFCQQNGIDFIRQFDVGTGSFIANTPIGLASGFHSGHGAMTVDSVGGYLYHASVPYSIPTGSIIGYRISDFKALGPCAGLGNYSAFSVYDGWRGLSGPYLGSDGGKLYCSYDENAGGPNNQRYTSSFVAPFYGNVDYPTAYQGEIESIEEDWELKISQPLANQGSPVIIQKTIAGTDCGNNQSPNMITALRIGPYGAELSLQDTDTLTTTTDATTTQNTPNTPNETITWTTRVELSGGNLVASVPAASSITIPDLNTITTSQTPTVDYIYDSQPDWSISGVTDTVPNVQGTQIFFDKCGTGVAYLKRLSYRISFTNAVVITPTAEDAIPNPWVPCVVADPYFVTSFFTGKYATSVLVDQTAKIGYFLLQDYPDIVNKVDLTTRTVTATASLANLSVFDDGYATLDEVGQKIYFTGYTTPLTIAQQTMNTLEFSPANVAYVIQRFGSTTYLFTLDVTNGNTTLVGNIGIQNISGLAFDGTDLYAVNGAGAGATTLYQIDPSNASVISTIGATGYSHLTSIAVHPGTGVLYGWVNQDTAGLVTISKITGVATSIGGISTNISDMSFHPTTNILYGVQASVGDIVTINLANGALTTVVPSVPIAPGLALGWDNGGTPALWFKWNLNPGDLTTVNLVTGTLNDGPLLAMLDIPSMTITLGETNADDSKVGVFDITAGYGYTGTQTGTTTQTIYKYDLSTLTLDSSLVLPGSNEDITAGAIDPAGGFAYFIHLTNGSSVKITKLDLGSFTVSTTTLLSGSDTVVRTATFLNGYLYLINETGFARKINPALSIVSTLQFPKTSAQTAYTIDFPQTVPVRGQAALDPARNLIYVGVNSPVSGNIIKIDATAFTVVGTLPLDKYFRGFHSLRSVGINLDPVGYGMPYGEDGYVVEFDFNSPPPCRIAATNFHQTHTTGQTNYSIQRCNPLNGRTTTKGIGMRRKWIIGSALGAAVPLPPTPIIFKNTIACNCPT